MEYTVIWRPDTINELADLWLKATDRESVSFAASQIDRQLRADPQGAGESRDGNTRVLIVTPIGVDYEINDGDCKVYVYKVWSIV